jgi:hypothetical protein
MPVLRRHKRYNAMDNVANGPWAAPRAPTVSALLHEFSRGPN